MKANVDGRVSWVLRAVKRKAGLAGNGMDAAGW